MIYLYLKTHNKTGLKYLGQTRQDPENYLGSGTRWLNHLRKHGNDIATEILKECKDDESLTEWGLHYSELWNIVDNEDFANLIPERGNQQYFPVENKNAKFKGCKWITNGKIDKKILKGENVQTGFWAGRTLKPLTKKRKPNKIKRNAKLLYEYQCTHCGIDFKRKVKARTENVFCNRSCRGKATPKISNPEGRNQYS